MRADSKVGIAVANLTALCELLADDGNLNAGLPPLRVHADADDGEPELDFTVANLRDDPNSYKGLIVDVTVRMADSEVLVEASLSHGNAAVDFLDDNVQQLGYDMVKHLERVLGDASDYSDDHPELARWFKARKQLRDIVEMLSCLQAGPLQSLVETVAAGTTAGALARDWTGDLVSLAQATGRLDEL